MKAVITSIAVLVQSCFGQCDFPEYDAQQWLEKDPWQIEWGDTPMLLKNVLRPVFGDSASEVSKPEFAKTFGHLDLLPTHRIDFLSRSTVYAEASRTSFADWTRQLATAGAVNYTFHWCFRDPECVKLVARTYGIPSMLTGISQKLFISAGSESRGVSLHAHEATWVALLAGTKQWFVARPSHEPPFPAFRYYTQATLAAHPDIMSCTQQTFDVVVIPPNWWHATYNMAGWNLAIGAQEKCTEETYNIAMGNITAVHDMMQVGNHALNVAIDSGHADIVNKLLQLGGSITDAGAEGRWSTILRAASAGHVAVLDTLISHRASVLSRGPNGEQPIHRASYAGHAALVATLVSQGVDINAVGVGGEQPVHLAAFGGHASVVRLLMLHRAHIQARGQDRGQPLHRAVMGGHTVIADLLLRQRASVLAVTNDDQQPVHIAASTGHAKVIKLLMTHRASSVATAGGQLPVHIAASAGNAAVIAELVNQGASVVAADSDGMQSLHHAVMEGHVAVAKLLVRRGAEISAWYPMHAAANEGHVSMVKLLISLRSSVIEADGSGMQPIERARAAGHSRIVKLLSASAANQRK